MAKNSARKKAARAYQAAHPGATLPEAMRAVALSEDPTPASADPTPTVDETTFIEPSRSGVDPNVRGQAIAVLTAIALSTHDNADQIDFADELSHILASVTANMGSVERLLLGRSGSWEAGLVAQLVNGTAMEEDLPRWRTAPVRLVLDVDDYWYHSGLEQVYTEDIDTLEELRYEHDDDRATDQAVIDEINDHDRRSYIEAWTHHTQEAATELGIEAPITVTVEEDTRSYMDNDPFTDRIERLAHERTPHPVVPELGELVGRRNHPPEELAMRIRAAGRSYRDRATHSLGSNDQSR